jgi:hypothetical protein
MLDVGAIVAAMPRVLQVLQPYEGRFLGLIDRFQRVWAYDVELRKATRGKAFRIRNPEVWEIILADRDILVIDFASWVTSVAGKGGFLDGLTADDLTEFGIEAGPAQDTDDSWLAAHDWKARVEAFGRLFPARVGAGKRWPEKADIRHLKAELAAATKGLEDQRHARAHFYDGRDSETAQNLGFEQIATVFHRVREVLNDTRLLVDHSTHHYARIAEPKDDHTARDLVDLLLLGSIDDAVREWKEAPSLLGRPPRVYLWQDREAYYEDRHHTHDEAAVEGRLFNDFPT